MEVGEEQEVEEEVELMVVKGFCLCCCSCRRRRLEELQREGVRSREEAELLQGEVTTIKRPTPETLE